MRAGTHVVGAAHDTSTSALSHLAMYLGRDAALRERLRAHLAGFGTGSPGHAELVQGGHRREEHGDHVVTVTRHVCERCGTAWEYTNDKSDQRAGWAVVGR